MDAKETIIKWFKEASAKLSNSNSGRMADRYICSILTILQHYQMAAISLINGDFKLPPMALLRAMYELVMKFIWCLQGTSEYKDVENRFLRWGKTTLNERIKSLNGFLESDDVPAEARADIQQSLKQMRDDFSKLPSDIKCMPQMTGPGGLYDQIQGVFDADISTLSYRQLCHATHIDTFVLANCIKKTDSSTHYTGDLDLDCNELLNHCLTNAWMFMKIIHTFYGWNQQQLDEDYSRLIPNADKK